MTHAYRIRRNVFSDAWYKAFVEQMDERFYAIIWINFRYNFTHAGGVLWQ